MATTVEQPPFSQVLRERSRRLHEHAEGASFVQALLNGDVDRLGYALMVTQHLFIYEALESLASDLRHDPLCAAFIADRLYRVPCLRADLDELLGPGWLDRVAPLPATARYVDRIRAMVGWPGGFVAHHYTRYLGDLSGGLAIGKTVARIYGLPGAGASFYRFEQIDRPAAFKDEYRANLDALFRDPAEQERVVGEVRTAYSLNTEVFAELARETGIGGRASGRPAGPGARSEAGRSSPGSRSGRSVPGTHRQSGA